MGLTIINCCLYETTNNIKAIDDLKFFNMFNYITSININIIDKFSQASTSKILFQKHSTIAPRGEGLSIDELISAARS